MTSINAISLFAQRDNFQSTTIYLDRSKPTDLVFYYLWSSENIENLRNRITALEGESRTIIVNLRVDIITHHRIIYLDEQNWKKARVLYAEYFFPFKKDLKQIAITGTNGKTTSCFLGMLLSNRLNINSLYIGTLGIYVNGKKRENHYLTTPSLIDYRRIVHQYIRDEKIDIVWVEASSHGIYQKRLEGIEFDAIGWTSFSQDHLDYHKTTNKYFQAKKLIFKQIKKDCEKNIKLGEKIEGLECYEIAKSLAKSPYAFLKVDHNHKNLSLVSSLLKSLGYTVSSQDLEGFDPKVPGRFHVLDDHFVIDYAHTPDALDRLIKQCSSIWPDKKILTLIGCGGDRDRSKRSIMAQTAAKKSDIVIFTEDNSRSENIDQIFSDMREGLASLPINYSFIKCRKRALTQAFSVYQNNPEKTLVILAGKGEENFISRNNQQIPHNDLEFIRGLYDIS